MAVDGRFWVDTLECGDNAVKLDDNVVSYVSPSSVEVPLADGLGLDIAARWGGATVYDYSLHVAC